MISRSRIALSPTLTVFLCVLFLVCAAGCSSSTPPPSPFDNLTFTVHDPQFARTVGQLLGPPLTPGNSVTTLVNGDEFFPAMLQAIASAQKTITIETYLYWSGDIGQQFADALAERARAGVKVHVLVDWFGTHCWMVNRGSNNENYFRQLRAAGAQVAAYHPFNLGDPATWAHLNLRTHRKILVIDGHLGFIGGAGIADEWSQNAQDPAHRRDTHYRVEGPVVAQMQSAFIEEWLESAGQVLTGDDYFPQLHPVGNQSAHIFKSSSTTGPLNMHMMMLLSIAAAGKNIRIESAYFIPDPLAEKALLDARRRGVHIEIIVPGPHTDAPILRHLSRNRWGSLLHAGIEIYEYQPTMLHSKLLIVDDMWVSVGSANFDNRSFRINTEANLNVLDSHFAAEQSALFEKDKAKSRRITLKEWNKRSPLERLRGGLMEPWRSEM